MAWLSLILMLATPVGIGKQENDAFDAVWTGNTLRFDSFHSGTAGEGLDRDGWVEAVSLDAYRVEGPWPGRRTDLARALDRGLFRFEVSDPVSGETLYAHGFSSIYGEWATTGEARTAWRTFHESQRFPEPRSTVRLRLLRRLPDGSFRSIWTGLCDPTSRHIDRSSLRRDVKTWALVEHGPPADKVDLLILGDGYREDEHDQYRSHVEAAAAALKATPPFRDRWDDFNVWAVDVAAQESGVSRPRDDVWRRSPLGLSYNAFDSERYVLTNANRALREVAACAPYDALILLANEEKYGGGGIHGLWMTAAAKSAQMPYLVVHEFGHSFAGLADEYYTSQVSYEDFHAAGVEPWEPNITALLDPEQLKWQDLVTPNTPVPTPWSQVEYDQVSLTFQAERIRLRSAGVSEERMETYFAEVKERTEAMLRAEPHFGKVGAFEGGGYRARGIYRPSADCLMFTRNPDHYCPVCTRAIEETIDWHLGRSVR